MPFWLVVHGSSNRVDPDEADEADEAEKQTKKRECMEEPVIRLSKRKTAVGGTIQGPSRYDDQAAISAMR